MIGLNTLDRLRPTHLSRFASATARKPFPLAWYRCIGPGHGIGGLTFRSLLWDLSQSWMKSWGWLLKLSMKSLWVFSWLMDSMVSWI